jgi:hypothetical protein
MSKPTFLKRQKPTVTATFILAATFLISLFHSNAGAQSISTEVEKPILPISISILNDVKVDTSDQLLESINNPGRDYVLNVKKLNREVFCMAQSAYFESGSESFRSKLAVAQVVKTRSETEGFPDTKCGVVKQVTVRAKQRTCQFSWWCSSKGEIPLYDKTGQIKPKTYQVWLDCVKAALLVYHEKAGKIVQGATGFYAHHQVKPAWTKKMRVVEVIDNQTFVAPRK